MCCGEEEEQSKFKILVGEGKKNGLDPKTSPIPLKFLRSYCYKKV